MIAAWPFTEGKKCWKKISSRGVLTKSISFFSSKCLGYTNRSWSLSGCSLSPRICHSMVMSFVICILYSLDVAISSFVCALKFKTNNSNGVWFFFFLGLLAGFFFFHLHQRFQLRRLFVAGGKGMQMSTGDANHFFMTNRGNDHIWQCIRSWNYPFSAWRTRIFFEGTVTVIPSECHSRSHWQPNFAYVCTCDYHI